MEAEEGRLPANGTRAELNPKCKPSSKKKCKPVTDSQSPASDSSTDEEPEPERSEKWSCSVCTFENSAGSFKCSMCFVRKGTSTRKPRINFHLEAQQVARQQQQIQQQALKATARAKEENHRKRPPSPSLSIGAASTSSESKRRNSDFTDPLVSPGPSKSRKEGNKKPKKTDKETKQLNGAKDEKKGVAKKTTAAGAIKKFRSMKNMDKSSSMSNAVTVNNVTVIITEFKPIKKDKKVKKVVKSKVG